MNNKGKSFKLPKAVTIMGRSSSITNSFVNGIIPVKKPTESEIQEALNILEQDETNVTCVYCGDKMTEWDHLYPLITDKHSTGYITEIANLVPSCGKCNQSKGNTNWLIWMQSNAKLSPKSRGISDIDKRIKLIDKYQKHFKITKINLEEIVGPDLWKEHWNNYDGVIDKMKNAQITMDQIKDVLRLGLTKAKSVHNFENRSQELILRDLKTIGMSTFVKYYKYFINKQYSRQELITLLTQFEDYTESSINTKVSIGMKIIREKNERNALNIILKSKNIDEKYIKLANDILNDNAGF